MKESKVSGASDSLKMKRVRLILRRQRGFGTHKDKMIVALEMPSTETGYKGVAVDMKTRTFRWEISQD